MSLRATPLTSKTLSLPTGRGRAEAAAPAGWQLDTLDDPAAGARRLGTEGVAEVLRDGGLLEAARGAKSVSILIPDATRVARSDVYVPALVEVLGEAGVPAAGVRVILATGTHAAVGMDDRAGLLGAEAAGLVVDQHDGRTPSGLEEVGTSSAGNAIALNRVALDTDLIVLTGRVSNHYFAGFSGGAKAVLPGIAAFETVVRNHRKVLDAQGRHDPRAANGRLDDNPVHLEMEEAAAMIRVSTFLANAIVANGAIVDFFAGSLAPTHRRACARADALGRLAIEAPYDVVVASCGGHPGDGSFMQAIKTPIGWGPAVRDGGVLIWVAGCGPLGLDAFKRWLVMPTSAAISDAAVRDYDLRAHNAVLLRQVAERCRLVLVSPLPAAEVRSLGLEYARDLPGALAAAAQAVGPAARALVVAQGNATYPSLKEPSHAALAA